jgi:hypothetical protein
MSNDNQPDPVTDALNALHRARQQAAEDAARSANRVTTAEQAVADALAAAGPEGPQAGHS